MVKRDDISEPLEVWDWDGLSWTMQKTSGPPTVRWHSLAYDAARQQIVMLGGITEVLNPVPPDTWLWDGLQWTLGATEGPTARFFAAFEYDSHRHACVLFGGRSSYTSYLNDTWEWHANPYIVEQPVDQAVSPGADTTFSVSALGAVSLTYQWRKDGVALSDSAKI